MNVPFGILAVVLGWVFIARTPGHGELRNDYVGIVLFGISVTAMVYPLIEGRAYDWPLWSWGLMAASVVFAALFFFWERRMARNGHPQLLNFSLISNANFVLGMVVVTIFASGIPGLFMVISILLQGGFGFSPLESGLTNTPFSVGVLIAAPIGGRFGSTFLRSRLAAGAALLVLGIGGLHFVIAGISDTIDHWWFAAPMFVGGVGLGLGFSALFQSVLAGVPPRDAGAGSGSLQAFQQVGGAIGIALVGQIFFSSLTQGFSTGSTPHHAFVDAAALAMLYQVVAFGLVVLLVPFLKRLAPGAAPAVAGARPVEA